MLKRRQIGEAAKLEVRENAPEQSRHSDHGRVHHAGRVPHPGVALGRHPNGYVILIVFVTAWLGAVGFLDDYLKVVRKKPKGLIGMYKIVGQVIAGLVVGGVIYFHPGWIDQTLVKYRSLTTVPFFKSFEVDFGVFYIPMVVFVITAIERVNLTDGLDGLAAGTIGIVAATLAVISYISGTTTLSQYLTIPFLRGNAELTVYCAALVARRWIFVVQCVSGAGIYGRYRLARARRSARHALCPH